MAVLEWVTYSLECEVCHTMFDGCIDEDVDDVIRNAEEEGWLVIAGPVSGKVTYCSECRKGA